MSSNPSGRDQDKLEKSNSNGIAQLSQERSTESNAIEIPSISLPKGGGALKGIDEKFEVNAANGTASFSIPLPLSPGRNGFAPALALSYNSGGGNSPFGLGWDVGLPSIQRKTDKGLPRYGASEIEDTFMFSGMEDLVPLLKEENNWKIQDKQVSEFTIRQYRPRIEGSFARIERITHPKQNTFWKVTTPDNVVTFFGRDQQARIADPEDRTHIFQWLPDFSYDDKGNWIWYEYKSENLENVPDSLAEHNRQQGLAKFTNTYLKRIRYGNRKAYYADPDAPYNPALPTDSEHFFEVVFDYGEHRSSNADIPEYGESPLGWPARPDAFSSYRSGFEIRTYRQCRGVLIYHHFPEEDDFGEQYLVRSLDLTYSPSSINQSDVAEVSYLQAITQTGYLKDGNTYRRKYLPPLEFTYQQLDWNTRINEVKPENIINAPVGLTNNYQWVDLYGEGISGILSEQADAWYYKSNQGDIHEDGQVAFAVARKVAPKPSYLGLYNGTLSLQDLEANGHKQIVVQNERWQGYFELGQDEDWQAFRAFSEVANINLNNPNTRLLDLNGDGQPDLVMTEERVFSWYAANGKKGHQAAQYAVKPFDEERGPAIVFADQEQTIFLADMSGDGLTDIARIRNGEICYWANKGYGRFSAKVNMDNAPLFDHPDQFNPQYLHLSDVSGTGATDIIYLGKNQFKAFINLSGNAWSAAHEIDPFFEIDRNSRLSVIDLLGTGTSCIVWSSDLPGHSAAPMRYIDLMNSKKPHVMIKQINNMGKETSVEYRSSTWYYLKDKLAGKPWITKLPFPVQVVAKTIVEEKITKVRFAGEYRYHHGYYDHPEREFRGFGLVEQLDTEYYDDWKVNNTGNQLEQSAELYQPPMLTKSWYHTGAFLDKERILNQYETEYWYAEYNRLFPEDPLTVTEPQLADAHLSTALGIQNTTMIDQLSADEWREALRACKGMLLRQEVFALDAPTENPDKTAAQKQAKPYSIATHNCHIQLLQPRSENPYGVFIVTESEALSISYEREEADPRMAHTLNIKLDDRGNILESATVVYPRQQVNTELPTNIQIEQAKTHIIYTQNSFTNDVIAPQAYRMRAPNESKTFEITGMNKPFYQLSDFTNILDLADNFLEYHKTPTGGIQHRIIEHIRSLYLRDDLSGPLPAGQLAGKGLPYESYQLAYTPALLDAIYGDKLSDHEAVLTEGRFVHSEGDNNWWIRSGLTEFMQEGESLSDVQNRFYSPLSYTDPFGSTTKVYYYKDYYLFLESTEDALGNSSQVERFDFRLLGPVLMRDINDNLSQVLTDELGLVKAVAILGKDLDGDNIPELELTDNLDGLESSLANEAADIRAFFESDNSNELNDIGARLLQNATSRFVYDFERYRNEGKPAVAAAINRETHYHHLAEGESSKLQFGFEYSDGLGRVAMVKAQAESGLAKQAIIQEDGTFQINEINTAKDYDSPRLRWIGNGRTILNNKGNPVKQYEPYFSVTPHYEDAKELVETGVTPILYYDAPGRLVRTELPNGTFSKVEFDSWQQRSFDPNDTVQESAWYQTQLAHESAVERAAAEKAAVHRDTPSTVHLDALGRPVLSIEHNRFETKDDLGNVTTHEAFYHTFIQLDIEGNALAVIDARGKTVMAYRYDMLGHRVSQNSMDAGKRWMLNNVMGNPVKNWDSKQQVFAHFYDVLQRPIYTSINSSAPSPLDHVFARVVYGDQANLSDAERQNRKTANQLGKPILQQDTSGQVSLLHYDLKGNLLKSQRQLLADYKNTPNWENNPQLEPEIFQTEITLDALNRPQQESIRHWKTTDSTGEADAKLNQRSYTYNEANLLNSVSAIANSEPEQVFVQNIDYDEKGQRTRIQYGNQTTTTYQYDPNTFRLSRLITTPKVSPQGGTEGGLSPSGGGAGGGNALLQDLNYTYDPVGNITHIQNDAENTLFFNNQQVEPSNAYEYDALYRLIFATGRDHASTATVNQPDSQKDEWRSGLTFSDSQALQIYRRHYHYDAVGNLLELRHHSGFRGSNDRFENRFTKTFNYSDSNNQLLRYTTGSGVNNTTNFNYDLHGNMLNLQNGDYPMQWNAFDQLQGVRMSTDSQAYYTYDGSGERVRKVIEDSQGLLNERLYLGGFEIYRQRNGLERETLHIMDDSGRIAMVETKTKQGTSNDDSPDTLIRYQYGNHLGSASLELNENGAIISYEEYYPYGTTSYQAINKDIKSVAKRYRYTGMERDAESGLNYHSARYYAPWLCRWTAADPIGIGDGVNVYGYVGGRPVKAIDPTGEEDTDPLSSEELEFIRSLSPEEYEEYIQGIVDDVAGQGYYASREEATESIKAYLNEKIQRQSKSVRPPTVVNNAGSEEKTAPIVLDENTPITVLDPKTGKPKVADDPSNVVWLNNNESAHFHDVVSPDLSNVSWQDNSHNNNRSEPIPLLTDEQRQFLNNPTLSLGLPNAGLGSAVTEEMFGTGGQLGNVAGWTGIGISSILLVDAWSRNATGDMLQYTGDFAFGIIGLMGLPGAVGAVVYAYTSTKVAPALDSIGYFEPRVEIAGMVEEKTGVPFLGAATMFVLSIVPIIIVKNDDHPDNQPSRQRPSHGEEKNPY